MSSIEWRPWSAEAFAHAAAGRKPVLLSLTASWCRGCDVMDRTTYRDPRVVDAIIAGFVPVRVDTDRRPDVNSRYNLDGWPTTVVLTPSGEMLSGSTYLTPDAMLSMLAEARAALETRYDELMERAEQLARTRRAAIPRARYEPDAEAPAWLVDRLFEEEDREYGGFGTGGKFLPAAPLGVALACLSRKRDARLEALVTRTLDAVCWRGAFDEVDGGFFRYTAGRDFTRPHTEKLLEDQLAMVSVLLEAARLLDRRAWRERAVDVIRYVRRTLGDPAGGFRASQEPDEEFYALSGSIRASLDPPRVDATLFTDLNAQAVVVWLQAAADLDEPDLQREALSAAGRLLHAAGDLPLPHWEGADAPRTLLTDQVHTAWALLHLATATHEDAYLTRASKVVALMLERFWDSAGGGFLDRAPSGDEVGLLQDGRRPTALNALAARVLVRLARATGAPDLEGRARETLGALTGGYRADGLGGAPYARAVLDVLHGAS